MQRYRSRLSGPLLDRIDMHIDVPAVQVKELIDQPAGEPSAAIRARVNQARILQRQRFQGTTKIYCNAQMSAKDVKKYCRLDAASTELLNQSITRLGLSARAYHRILKIALTIADLDGAGSTTIAHVAEAVQYRRIQYER